MAKTPKIRFKNFTDEWVEREIGDLLEERNKQSPESKEYPLMAFIANIGVTPKGDRYDRSALVKDSENKFYKQTELGDFIYSSNNLESGSIGLNNYGKASISPVYSIFKVTKIANSNFIGTRLVRKDFINNMVKWRQGVIYGQWKIHEANFIKIQILVPNLKEQEKIGAFFSKLDKLIALHQSKFEKLQKIKKSCLQNLFPQNNQNTPKIRFKNFSDEWENNNLGEICKIIKGEQINKLSLLENGKYYVLNGGISPSGYINTYNTLENTISISEGGNSCGYVKFNIEKFWSGGHNYTLNELKTKTLFLYSFLKAKQQKIMALRVGSGLPNIQKNTLSNISISIPNKKEQEKIGAFFSKLDKLITLHQSKFEKLQKIKKSCLQNMFV